MAETFSIRIVDEEGDGLEGVDVVLNYAGLLGGSDSETTDSDGWAEFSLQRDFGVALPKTIESVVADGTTVATDITPDDEETFSFTLNPD